MIRSVPLSVEVAPSLISRYDGATPKLVGHTIHEQLGLHRIDKLEPHTLERLVVIVFWENHTLARLFKLTDGQQEDGSLSSWASYLSF